ncbi:MAG: hypothetical protein ACP5N3_02260 [Candidatus Nanoarchaeia archaeon]
MKSRTKAVDSLDSFLLKYARVIDDVDMFLAPASTLAAWHNDETIRKLGIIGIVIDLGILKTPFVAMYTLRTGDYKTPVAWLGWEILAHAIPYEGGLLSIRRNYEKSTNEYYKIKEREEYKD